MDRPYLLRTDYHSQQQRAVRDGAHPDILEFERVFIRRMAKKHGVPLFAHNMVRTPAEQLALYVQGLSRNPGDDGFAHLGCAVDIVHCVKAWGLSKDSWTILGHIGKEVAHSLGIKVEWGGDWSFYDPAHWQLAGWREKIGEFPF